MTAGDDLAAVVSEQLARGAVGRVRELMLDPEVPAPITQAPRAPAQEDAFDAWMAGHRRPCIAPPPPTPSSEGMTMGEMCAHLYDLHHQLMVMRLQRDAFGRRVTELEALAAGPRTSDAEPAEPQRWAALRPSAGAPREPLALGCVRAVGACSCEGCTEREADTRAMRALVAATMVECGASKATGLLVLRGIFDAEAIDAVCEGCEDIGESKNGPVRSLMLAWLGDLVAGRFDRIERSDAAWHRTDCVPCVRAAFDVAALTCDRCASEVVP